MTKMPSLKSGTCPQCASQEVYTTQGNYINNYRSHIMISTLKQMRTDTYICTACGYFEEYLMEDDLHDPKKIQKIKQNWKKV
jgi:C4-type Zn-finger protein